MGLWENYGRPRENVVSFFFNFFMRGKYYENVVSFKDRNNRKYST